MKPIAKPLAKALLLGLVPAGIVFARVFFAEEIQEAQRGGILLTRCYGESPETLAIRAGYWAFLAFAALFLPTLTFFWWKES